MQSTPEGKGQDGLFAEPKAPGQPDAGQSKESEAPSNVVTPEKLAERTEANTAQAQDLESRSAPSTPSAGNPHATVADPMQAQVLPRYDVVQNRSPFILIIADLKNHLDPEDRGLRLEPGDVVKLTDFYSPQEINRSRGLRHAAMKIKGVGEAFALVPLRTEEEGEEFKVPERTKHAKGATFEDTAHNDFDDRFLELEMREAKREEKLLKKTLGMRRTKEHGRAPSRV